MWPWCGRGAAGSASRSPATGTRSWDGAAERRKTSTRSCRHTRCSSTFPKARWRRRRISFKRLGQMTKQKSVRRFYQKESCRYQTKNDTRNWSRCSETSRLLWLTNV
uniref:Uncharacterized protein n=1 Tax=Amazona collaria TaxID=241587 RepID=A0A8B9F6U7_9PSIT